MDEKGKQLIILTGLSGAGKTTCLGLLEDIGFFCVDNIPPNLLAEIMNLFGKIETQKIAIVVDARWRQDLSTAVESIKKHISVENLWIRVLFVEASEEAVIKRYALTRRKHPLEGEGGIEKAYKNERKLLEPLREISDFVIDTTGFNTHQLREHLKNLLQMDFSKKEKNIALHVVSFGYKFGMPSNADFIIDTRFLPNPFWKSDISDFTGLDKEVIEFLESFPLISEYLEQVLKMLDIAVSMYESEGRNSLAICIGCTGGKHRSVYFAERICEFFVKKSYSASAEHRDLN